MEETKEKNDMNENFTVITNKNAHEMKLDIRDELITGTFLIGHDGRKEPPDWRVYALKLEQHLKQREAEAWTEGAIAASGGTLPAAGLTNPYV